MSVLIVDAPVFDRVAYKMFLASVNKCIDDSYFPCCRNMSTEDIDVLINKWYGLNVLSFCVAYREEIKINWRSMKRYIGDDKIPSVLFVKWLQSIRYNIEISAIESAGISVSDDLKEAVNFLDKLIVETLNAIVRCLPEYDKAPWGKLPEEVTKPVESASGEPLPIKFDFCLN